MVVALGATDVPFSKRSVSVRLFRSYFFPLIFFALAASFDAWAINETSPMHWSGDKTYWDRKTSHVELIGNAQVHQPGETLTADYIVLDLESRTIDAKGHAVYIASGSIIYGEEMHFNLDTRTGSVVWGRVSNDAFTLTGERINKLGPTRFQTHNGEYSTCKDCPHSWTLTGADVDIQMEGYGYFRDVTGKVKDAPLFWMPYLIVPLKTKRQSGLLFPHFGFVNGNFNFVEPFFWAINRSSDMTIALGNYGSLGTRAEVEGRYNLGGGSSATANYYFLNDATFPVYLGTQHVDGGSTAARRWAVNLSQTQVLPFHVDEKLRVLEVSDNLYPSKIGDIPGGQEAFLTSDLSFSHTTSYASTYVTGRRYRDMLFSDPDPRKFDPGTVQVFPQAQMKTNDRFLFDGPIAGGVNFGVTNFTRTGRTFDRDQFNQANASAFSADAPARLGQDPLRKATRMEVTPTLYTTFRPWDVLSVVPSAQFHEYYYSFHQVAPNLSRQYLLLQVDLSTQFERIYDTSPTPDDLKTTKVKHLIRPLFTYSMIPYVHQPGDHPFIEQMNYASNNSFTGYNFDNEDIVPVDSSGTNSNYFTPQGNALAYGFTTQLIRRRSPLASLSPSYQRSVELQTGQSINFRELRKDSDTSQPLSRYFALLTLEFDKWGGGFNYFYYPYGPTGGPVGQGSSRNVYSANTYYNFELSKKQRVFAFERSINLNYSYDREATTSQTQNLRAVGAYSLNDYLLPRVTLSYDFVQDRWQEVGASLSVANPSQCWKFDVNVDQAVATNQLTGQPAWDTHVGFTLSFNLAGTGFGGLTESMPGAH